MDGRIWAPSGRTAKPSGSIPAQAIDLPERPSSLKRSSAPTTSSPAPGPSATATDSATAELVQEFVAHCDRLRRAGNRTDAKAYAFPYVRGGRLSRRRVAEIVRDAAEQASQRARARPSAHDPAHAAARVRLARAAGQTRFDVLQVMGRVGHAARGRPWTSTPNSSSGFKREHGMAFDRLVDQAREHFNGGNPRGPRIVIRATIWPRTGPTRHGLAAVAGGQNSLAHRGNARHGDDSPGRASAATANGALTGCTAGRAGALRAPG